MSRSSIKPVVSRIRVKFGVRASFVGIVNSNSVSVSSMSPTDSRQDFTPTFIGQASWHRRHPTKAWCQFESIHPGNGAGFSLLYVRHRSAWMTSRSRAMAPVGQARAQAVQVSHWGARSMGCQGSAEGGKSEIKVTGLEKLPQSG